MLFANSAVVSLGKQVIDQVCEYFEQIDLRKPGSYSGSVQGLVELKNITVIDSIIPQYASAQNRPDSDSIRTVLSNISLQAGPGEITALIGSVGAGQSEVIKVLLGKYQPESGDCLIDSTRRADWCGEAIQKHIVVAGESVSLPQVTILDLISRFAAVDNTQALEAAQLTGLNQRLIELNIAYNFFLDDQARGTAIGLQLEGSITLTAAVVSEAKIIPMENPETYCNAIMLNKIQLTLQSLKQQNRTVILTTHSKQLIKLAQRSYLYDSGNAIAPPISIASNQRVA